jgi:hypothetical protein
MSHLTPIGSRLTASLNDEYMRMQNEWFFKWHSIGSERGVEIESFNGKPICYGGIRFSGSAHHVYWATIQRYLQKKVGSIFDDLESELSRYSPDVKARRLMRPNGSWGSLPQKFARRRSRRIVSCAGMELNSRPSTISVAGRDAGPRTSKRA